MADSPTQDGRIGKLATPLGKDKLCLTRFEGSEAIGELFEYRIEAVSTDPNLDFNAALGKNCSVHIETTDHVGRDFGGILTEARWAGCASTSRFIVWCCGPGHGSCRSGRTAESSPT